MLPHFLYINSLYDEEKNNSDIKQGWTEWLIVNIGKEGNASNSLCDDNWAWSLTRYRDNTSPVGIYFKNSEDMLRFKITFGGSSDRGETW